MAETSFVDDIIGALPVGVRQVGAGFATIPSETANAGVMLANPLRAYRQIMGRALPEDSVGTLADIQRMSQGYNESVNKALQVENPSFQDNTGQALLRMLGGAVPVPTTAISRLPTAARAVANVAEVLTPLTLTNKTGAARIAPVAMNTLVPTAAGVGIEHAVEPVDPTATVDEYDENGKLVGTLYPAHEPGVGRAVANNVVSAVRDHPIPSALGAAAMGAGMLLARGHNNRLAAVRNEAATSNIVVPRSDIDADVPVPMNPVRRGMTDTAELLQDTNATQKEAVRQALPSDPKLAEQINSFSDLATEQAHTSRVIALRRDGVMDTPGGLIRTIPIDRTAEELAHASLNKPELLKNVNERLSVETELDNRSGHIAAADILRQRKWKNERIAEDTPHLVAIDSDRPKLDANGQQMVVNGDKVWEKDYITPRATLHDISDADLIATANRLRTPETEPWAQRYWQFHKDTLHGLRQFEAIGTNEESKMLKANPHYRHTNNFEGTKSPFTTRLREHMAGPATAGDPWDASREYAHHALDFAYRNRRGMEIGDAFIKAKELKLPGSEIIGKIADPRQLRRMTLVNSNGTQGRQMTKADIKLEGDIHRYKVGDDLVEMEIKNKAVYNALRTMPRHVQTVMGGVRGIAESSMTGKLATLMGQPFAAANAIMGAPMAVMLRPRNLPMGIGDRAVHDLTGSIFGKDRAFGLRGDPTAYPGIASTAVKNVSLVMGKAFSDALKNSIVSNGMLAKAVPNAKGFADYLAKVWADSMYAKQFRHGAGDVPTLGGQGIDTTTRSSMVSGMEHMEQARVIDPTKPQTFKRYLQTLGQTAVPADAKIAWRVLGEIQQAIANSPQAYAYGTNIGRRTKGLSREEAFREAQKVASEVRQLIGDPAIKGTGLRDFNEKGTTLPRKVVGTVFDATPYANIGQQALGRVVHAFRTNFWGTTAAVAATMGPLVVLPILRMIQLDKAKMERGEKPEYLPYILQQPAWFNARFVVVPIAGVPANQSPTIRLDPISALIQAPAVYGLLKYLGIAGNKQYELMMPDDATVQQLQQFADDRLHAGVVTGLLSALPINQAPTPVAAGFNAAGVELGTIPEFINRGGALPINERGLAGYGSGSIQNAPLSKRMEAFFSSLFPGLATTLGAMLTAGIQSERREPGTGARAALGEMAGRSRDRFGELNGGILFEQPRRRATQDPAAELVNAREQAMRNLATNYSSIPNEGMIGSGQWRERGEGGGRAGVADPQMRDLIAVVNAVWNKFEAATGERTRERERLLDIKQRGNVDFLERRRQENAVAERISAINHRLLNTYQRLEEQLSTRYGREIRLDRIDPTKPITQFPELERQ